MPASESVKFRLICMGSNLRATECPFRIPTGKARIKQYDFCFASNSRYLRVEEYTPQRAASPFYDVDERKIRRWLAGDTRILESIAMLLRGNDPAPLCVNGPAL